MTFADALRAQIEAHPLRLRRNARIKAVLDMRDDERKQKILAKMEEHARVHLDLPASGDVDWSAPGGRDWSSFFDALSKFLLAILPLLLTMFG